MSFVERFAAEGWLEVGRVFDIRLVDALRDEVDRQYALLTAPGEHRGYLQVGDERVMLSVMLSGPFLDPALFANPILMGILGQFLGEGLLIDSFTCVVALPAAGEQKMHRDVPVLFPERPEIGWQAAAYAVTVAIPLVDLTPETGTTRLFPRTHRGAEPEASELPFARRGDCFLMDVRLQHQGTPNVSGSARPMLYIVYSRPWFTDMENFRGQPRINVKREDLAKVPPQHWPLFRRLAAKGGVDLSEEELFAAG